MKNKLEVTNSTEVTTPVAGAGSDEAIESGEPYGKMSGEEKEE